MPSKRSSTCSANRLEMDSCAAARMLTAKCDEEASTLWMKVRWSMQQSTSGGSRLSEQKALTVMPKSFPDSSRAVTTVMPEAKRPRTLWKVAGSSIEYRVRDVGDLR